MMQIPDSVSNVGIGINTPQNLLHVHSTGYNGATGTGTGASTSGTGFSLKGSNSNLANNLVSESVFQLTNKESGNNVNDGLKIHSYNNNAAINLKESGNFYITANNSEFEINQQGDFSMGGSNAEKFKVKQNGEVYADKIGVGVTDISTTPPNTRLEIDNGNLK